MVTLIPHTIRVRIPNARQVSIVGDFNRWHSGAHPLVQIGEDLWERIVDLPGGKHRYALFVLEDGMGALRSRVVGNGSVLYVPERAGESVTVTPHPALALRAEAAPREERRVA